MRNAALLGTRLIAAGPGKFRLGPALPRSLAVAAAAGGGLLAASLLAKMLTAKPVPAEPAGPSPDTRPA